MANDEQTTKGRVNASRRAVMKAGLAGAVAVGTGLVSIVEAQTPAGSANRAPATATGARMNGPLFFDVETASGVVRGMANTGIKVFRGIPYGADTSRKNRFMPPHKLTAWTGVRSGIGYGPIAPQTASSYRSDYSQLIQWDKHVGSGGMSEDCLSLNIWTPGPAIMPGAPSSCRSMEEAGRLAPATDRCMTSNPRSSATWSSSP
jgi:para-nitrobenzyl esterase